MHPPQQFWRKISITSNLIFSFLCILHSYVFLAHSCNGMGILILPFLFLSFENPVFQRSPYCLCSFVYDKLDLHGIRQPPDIVLREDLTENPPNPCSTNTQRHRSPHTQVKKKPNRQPPGIVLREDLTHRSRKPPNPAENVTYTT